MSAYCRWYEKNMENVTEHEQEQCEEIGRDCKECEDRVDKENNVEKIYL